MDIKSAIFEISNSDYRKCPSGNMHEYAFIGRSNVGKSSLINMLTGRKNLALTSSTPGKTMLINHFKINDSWYIVDLPGYGYAQRGKESRRQLQKIIDTEFMEWLAENGVPFSIVFTRTDKLSKEGARKNIEKYCESLLETWESLPPIFVTSSEDGRGKEELLAYIEELNKLPLENAQP